MEAATLALLFAGGLLSGAITAMAGGGSFLTFPMLLAAGLPPMTANITNWVALMPGNFMALAAYRTELTEMRHDARPHLLVAFFGGLAGGLLLLWTGEVQFEKAVPWLMLTATLFFAFGEWVKKRLHAWRKPGKPVPARAILVFEFVLMVYGGYFGAGLGIMLMAILTLLGVRDVQEANAVKNAMATVVTSAAVMLFVATGSIAWTQGSAVLLGAIVGGYTGARLARWIPPLALRWTIVATGLALSAYFGLKAGA
jgi:hypothetical protein